MNIGAWVAIGTGIGTAMFAATREPYWIALGAGIGTAIGAAATRRGDGGDGGGPGST